MLHDPKKPMVDRDPTRPGLWLDPGSAFGRPALPGGGADVPGTTCPIIPPAGSLVPAHPGKPPGEDRPFWSKFIQQQVVPPPAERLSPPGGGDGGALMTRKFPSDQDGIEFEARQPKAPPVPRDSGLTTMKYPSDVDEAPAPKALETPWLQAPWDLGDTRGPVGILQPPARHPGVLPEPAILGRPVPHKGGGEGGFSIDEGGLSVTRMKPGEVVVRDPASFEKLWDEVKGTSGSRMDAPRIDFGRHSVVGVFLGAKPHSGYGVEVVGTTSRKDGALVVQVRERVPSPGLAHARTVTQPYQLVAVPKVPAGTPVVFDYVKRDDRQVHHGPVVKPRREEPGLVPPISGRQPDRDPFSLPPPSHLQPQPYFPAPAPIPHMGTGQGGLPIHQGNAGYGTVEAGESIVRDQAAFDSLWKALHDNQSGAVPAPPVDFSRQTVLGVFRGDVTGGYGIEVTGTRTLEDGSLEVSVTRTSPPLGVMSPAVMTSPYQIVTVPKVPEGTPIRFTYVGDAALQPGPKPENPRTAPPIDPGPGPGPDSWRGPWPVRGLRDSGDGAPSNDHRRGPPRKVPTAPGGLDRHRPEDRPVNHGPLPRMLQSIQSPPQEGRHGAFVPERLEDQLVVRIDSSNLVQANRSLLEMGAKATSALPIPGKNYSLVTVTAPRGAREDFERTLASNPLFGKAYHPILMPYLGGPPSPGNPSQEALRDPAAFRTLPSPGRRPSFGR